MSRDMADWSRFLSRWRIGLCSTCLALSACDTKAVPADEESGQTHVDAQDSDAAIDSGKEEVARANDKEAGARGPFGADERPPLGVPNSDGGSPFAAGGLDDGSALPPDVSGPSLVNDAGAVPPPDRCESFMYDPADPPTTLPLSGSLGTHDPTLIESHGVFYLWQTGPRLPAKTSRDLMKWNDAPAAFTANPAWIASEVPEATDLWAPDVSFFGGQYHLYYSASKFASNSSCIGHATRPSLESGRWSDQGKIICSNHGARDDWNAIDPNVIQDVEGKLWLSFGSFWSGIKAIELAPSGARATQTIYSLAKRDQSVEGAIEAPFIVRRCGYYYLFVSFDKCCVGTSSTYNIRVGRSEKVMGPYVAADGTPMLQGGGSPLVKGNSRYAGPGHSAVLFSGDRAYNVYHSYDAQQDGRPTLRVSELAWKSDGWPLSAGP